MGLYSVKFLLVKLAKFLQRVHESVKAAFGTMRLIVTVGWAIYPLGYFFSYLGGSADPELLNVIYNVADVINKIAFVAVIWAAANKETA